jgi:hypothetical protein
MALRIKNEKNLHALSGKLVKPYSMEIAEVMCGKDAKLQIAQIPLSNYSIHHKIKDMLEDIRKQVVQQIKRNHGAVSQKALSMSRRQIRQKSVCS